MILLSEAVGRSSRHVSCVFEKGRTFPLGKQEDNYNLPLLPSNVDSLHLQMISPPSGLPRLSRGAPPSHRGASPRSVTGAPAPKASVRNVKRALRFPALHQERSGPALACSPFSKRPSRMKRAFAPTLCNNKRSYPACVFRVNRFASEQRR